MYVKVYKLPTTYKTKKEMLPNTIINIRPYKCKRPLARCDEVDERDIRIINSTIIKGTFNNLRRFPKNKKSLIFN